MKSREPPRARTPVNSYRQRPISRTIVFDVVTWVFRGQAPRAAGGRAADPHPSAPRDPTSDGAPVDLVVAALHQSSKLTATAIAHGHRPRRREREARALKALVEGGQVRIYGKARGRGYAWRGG